MENSEINIIINDFGTIPGFAIRRSCVCRLLAYLPRPHRSRNAVDCCFDGNRPRVHLGFLRETFRQKRTMPTRRWHPRTDRPRRLRQRRRRPRNRSNAPNSGNTRPNRRVRKLPRPRPKPRTCDWSSSNSSREAGQ